MHLYGRFGIRTTGADTILTKRVTEWLHMVVDTFDAIGDPTRRAILDLLRQGPMSAGTIAAAFPSSRPGISRHLRHLREANAVIVDERGRSRVYQLAPDWQRPIMGWLRRFDPPYTEAQ